MRYVMRQKLLSLADNFTIKDENERDACLVISFPFRMPRVTSASTSISACSIGLLPTSCGAMVGYSL